MRKLGFVVSGLVLMTVQAAVFAQPTQLPFETAQAAYQMLPERYVFDGTVEAVKRSTVAAQIAGRIEEIRFDVDDYVEEGQVIVRFRDQEQRARLEQAKGALQEARAAYEEARAEYDRVKRVFERNLVSQSEMDRARSARDAAKARLEAAQARVAEAQERLEHTVVRAPYSGYVTKRHVEVGETAQPGQPLMTGISLDQLRVRVDVPQSFADQVRRFGRARVQLPGPEAGYVDSEQLTVFPYADERTHTFRVRVQLPREPKGLFPGMLVKVGFVVGEQRRLLVPEQAVARRSEVTAVYVVDASQEVHLRQIQPGRRQPGELIEVLSGLEAGERVALDPVAAAAYRKEHVGEVH